MKLSLFLIASFVWVGFMVTPIAKQPALGPLLNYSTGLLQVQPPELGKHHIQLTNDHYSGNVYIDSIGIPHIFAGDDASASYLLGYMHARDRLFQMDLITRMMSAELSELVGDVALPSDTYWINFQFKQQTRDIVKQFQVSDPQGFALLAAYAEGVNSYIDRMSISDLPEEYHLLGAAPRRWAIENPFYLIKYMAKMLNHRTADLELQSVFNSLPKHLVQQFYPLQEDYLEVIIPEKSNTSANLQSQIWLKNKNNFTLSKAEQEARREALVYGSNNWAVSGKKSASGEAFLANDMHLALSLPGPWYEVHIKTPTKHVYGLSIPAGPVIVAGFNEAISWGLTNAHWDLVDYLRVEFKDSTHLIYGNKQLAIETDEAFIPLKNGSKKRVQVKRTVRGPLIDIQGETYLVDWTGFQRSNEFKAFSMVEKSSNWQEFTYALSYLATPPQNFVFADTAGNIGLITNGQMPIKAKDRQRGVFVSSDSLATFRGYLDQSDLPQIYNPKKGFIASANQRQIYNAKHYFNGSNMAPPYRGKSISDNLRSIASATPEDMTRVQADITDLSAADLLPLLLTEIEGQATYTAAFEYLKNWNHKMAKDQIAPTIYDQFRKQLFYEFQNRVLKNTEIIPPPDYVVIRELVKNETFNQITRREILLASFDAALRELSDHFGEDVTTWIYGRYHQTEMTHLLQLDAFSEPKFASDGSKYTVNVARGPKVTAGSSQRSVIHMTTPVEAWMNIAGGQSGRPSSRNFKNQIPRWKMVDLRKVEFVDSVGDLKSYVQKISVGDDDE